VASFGTLTHFRAAEAPEGAGTRCLDCAIEADCPYSARRIYLERFAEGDGWPISVITEDPSPAGRLQALRSGPYGRCVYGSDNDVADHQVVALSFADGVTASLSVHAFSEANTRTISLSGTRGELHGRLEEGRLELREFLTGRSETIDVRPGTAGEELELRHAGGDDGLMADLTDRLAANLAGGPPPSLATSWLASLESHAMAFAAERARRHDRVVAVPEVLAELG
jgi:predicted dehydrogenase